MPRPGRLGLPIRLPQHGIELLEQSLAPAVVSFQRIGSVFVGGSTLPKCALNSIRTLSTYAASDRKMRAAHASAATAVLVDEFDAG